MGRKFPKGGKPISFTDLVDPTVEAVRYAYDLTLKEDGPIPWTGPQFGERDMSVNHTPEHLLTAEYLRKSRELYNRDPLTVIIGIGVLIGIEQGRRIATEETKATARRDKVLARAKAERKRAIKKT